MSFDEISFGNPETDEIASALLGLDPSLYALYVKRIQRLEPVCSATKQRKGFLADQLPYIDVRLYLLEFLLPERRFDYEKFWPRPQQCTKCRTPELLCHCQSFQEDRIKAWEPMVNYLQADPNERTMLLLSPLFYNEKVWRCLVKVAAWKGYFELVKWMMEKVKLVVWLNDFEIMAILVLSLRNQPSSHLDTVFHLQSKYNLPIDGLSYAFCVIHNNVRNLLQALPSRSSPKIVDILGKTNFITRFACFGGHENLILERDLNCLTPAFYAVLGNHKELAISIMERNRIKVQKSNDYTGLFKILMMAHQMELQAVVDYILNNYQICPRFIANMLNRGK